MNPISNRQLTLLRKLQRKKYREQEQLFLVEGRRAVKQVVENGVLDVKALFFDKTGKLWTEPAFEQFADQWPSAVVEESDYRDVTDTQSPQGICALCRMPGEGDLDEMSGSGGVIVATDRIQDPGNLGTIYRSAGWFGVAGLLLGEGTVDPFNPKVVRSTAGSTGILPFAHVSLSHTLAHFEEQQWRILLLDASEEAADIGQLNTRKPTVLVIGNEAGGIDPSLYGGRSRTPVKIPARGTHRQVESLNASIALSIALYAVTA
ncbi:MAG: RNA methyltransferase [Balneolaceae bacterium]|nr:RNA methyltransferase [Balneolaceae bacterium]